MELFHCSIYNNKELKPGYWYTKKEVKWDHTESNKFLYADKDIKMAIVNGMMAGLEQRFESPAFKFENNVFIIYVKPTRTPTHVSKAIYTKFLLDLKLYLYTIKQNADDGWIPVNNKFNNLKTEYKTNNSIPSRNFVKTEINMQSFLKEHNIIIRLEPIKNREEQTRQLSSKW